MNLLADHSCLVGVYQCSSHTLPLYLEMLTIGNNLRLSWIQLQGNFKTRRQTASAMIPWTACVQLTALLIIAYHAILIAKKKLVIVMFLFQFHFIHTHSLKVLFTNPSIIPLDRTWIFNEVFRLMSCIFRGFILLMSQSPFYSYFCNTCQRLDRLTERHGNNSLPSSTPTSSIPTSSIPPLPPKRESDETQVKQPRGHSSVICPPVACTKRPNK